MTGYTMPVMASMEPGHEDREYAAADLTAAAASQASMEPGHEDREYYAKTHRIVEQITPQWSPVMKTGNTASN